MLVATKPLSRRTCFCRDKTFLVINICSNKHNFVKHNNFDKHNKHLFVATKHVFCRHACVAVITILASGPADLAVCDAVIMMLAFELYLWRYLVSDT